METRQIELAPKTEERLKKFFSPQIITKRNQTNHYDIKNAAKFICIPFRVPDAF